MKSISNKNVETKIQKEVDKRVKEEVEKNLSKKLIERTRASTQKFRNEFRIQTVTAITAAFAFLIALSWRVPIEKTVNNIIQKLSLQGSEMFIQYMSAVIITFIAVLALIFLSRWKSEKE
jgi:uncharacterized membrane protein YdbT with pleckstrin-like domain